MKRFIPAMAALGLALALFTVPAVAGVTARVDISQQRMFVSVNGRHAYTWRVSTARHGYYTPRGSYRPTSLQRMHYSKKYHNSPMPHSIFFRGGYAIHGSYATRSLGYPASHGCIRLLPSHAAELYWLVSHYGSSNTRIVVTN